MKTETINLPTKVIDSDWKDDVDYEPYNDEKTYISPDSIKKETLTRIKNSSVRLAIEDMVNLKKILGKVAA